MVEAHTSTHSGRFLLLVASGAETSLKGEGLRDGCGCAVSSRSRSWSLPHIPAPGPRPAGQPGLDGNFDASGMRVIDKAVRQTTRIRSRSDARPKQAPAVRILLAVTNDVLAGCGNGAIPGPDATLRALQPVTVRPSGVSLQGGLGRKSRMTGDCHVRFHNRLGATRPPHAYPS